MKRTSCLLIILLAFAKMSFAQFEPEVFSQLGYSVAIDALPYKLPSVEDDKFMEMKATNWRINYKHRSVKDRISLWIKDTSIMIPKLHYIFHFRVDTFGINGDSGFFLKELQITYDPQSHQAYIDKNVFEFENIHKYTLSIENIYDSLTSTFINTVTPAIWENIGIKAEILAERYYLASYSLPVYSLNHSVVDNSLVIDWAAPTGSTPNTYELEWAYIDTFGINPDSLKYDFNHNSTRILTGDNTYNLHLIYDAGLIIYRVRRVRPDSVYFLYPKKSDWLPSYNNIGYVKDYSSSYKIYFETHENSSKNWNYSITFAEKGLKKEVVNYFDGSLKRRQGVTMNNTDNFTIVDESIYDYHGREAIKVLPTPTSTDSFSFYPNFSLNSSNEPYSSLDFDESITVGDICSTIPQPMSTDRGASKYYSPNNPDKLVLENQYIPDAQGYPFAQTEYMPDGSGRIRRQGGVGITHQIGSGHETRYLYGKPEQDELKQLFGSEVGDYKHYKENAVIDPNGQASVSYIDQHGRVIATALAGNSPSQMSTVDKYQSAKFITETLTSENNITNLSENSIQFRHPFNVVSGGHHSIQYKMTSPAFYFSCVGISPCYNCVYDYQFTLLDDCQNPIVSFKQRLGQLSDSNCMTNFKIDDSTSGLILSGPLAINADSIYGELGIGNYTILKTLSVNTDSLQYYFRQRIALDSCFKTENDFQLVELGKLDSIDCNQCDTCGEKLSLCQIKKDAMVGDYIPSGGQYADVKFTYGYPIGSDDHASIFNWHDGQFRYAALDTGSYKNDDGTSSFINIGGSNYYPQHLNIKQFIDNYQESWGEALMAKYHPEYCRLQYCLTTLDTSYNYDELMHNTESYDSALARGFLDPLDMDAGTPTSKDPFFFTGGVKNSLGNTVTTQLTNYTIQYGGTNNFLDILGDHRNFNIWQMALAMSHCDYINDDKEKAACYLSFTNDSVVNYLNVNDEARNSYWMTFKGLYQNEKRKLVEGELTLRDTGAICGSIPEGKYEYFLKASKLITSAIIDGFNSNPNTLKNAMQDSINLSPVCESQIPAWEEKLKFCPNWDTYKDSIIAGFLEVCNSSRGVNGVEAMGLGSSYTIATAVRFNSFEDVLTYHLGSEYRTMLCNVELIDWPPPFNPLTENNNATITDCHCKSIEHEILEFKGCLDTMGSITPHGYDYFNYLKRLDSMGHFEYQSLPKTLSQFSGVYDLDLIKFFNPLFSSTGLNYVTMSNTLLNDYTLVHEYYAFNGTDDLTELNNNSPKCNVRFKLPENYVWSDLDSLIEPIYINSSKIKYGIRCRMNNGDTVIVTMETYCLPGLVEKCVPRLEVQNYGAFLEMYNAKNSLSVTKDQLSKLIAACPGGGGGGTGGCFAEIAQEEVPMIQVLNQYLRKNIPGQSVAYRINERSLTDDNRCWKDNINKPNFMVESPSYLENFYMNFNRFNNIWWEPPINELVDGKVEITNNLYMDSSFLGGVWFGKDCDSPIVKQCFVSFGNPYGELTALGGISEVDSIASIRYDYNIGEYIVTGFKITNYMGSWIPTDSARISFNSCYTNCKPQPTDYTYETINESSQSSSPIDLSIGAYRRQHNMFLGALNFIASVDSVVMKGKNSYVNLLTYGSGGPSEVYIQKYLSLIAAPNGALRWHTGNMYPKYNSTDPDSVLIAFIGDNTLDEPNTYQLTFRKIEGDLKFQDIEFFAELKPDIEKIKELIAQGRQKDAAYYFMIKGGKVIALGDTSWMTMRGFTSTLKLFEITNTTVTGLGIELPRGIAPECNCLTCPEVKEGLDSFFSQYPMARTNHPNYPTMVTTYLNKFFKTQLGFPEYQQYFDNCLMEYYSNIPNNLADIRITTGPSSSCVNVILTAITTINDSIGNTLNYTFINKDGTTAYFDFDLSFVSPKYLGYVGSTINTAMAQGACSSSSLQNDYVGAKFITVALTKNGSGETGCSGSMSDFVTWAKTNLNIPTLSYTTDASAKLKGKGWIPIERDAEYYTFDSTGIPLKQRSYFVGLLDSWANNCSDVHISTNSYLRRHYNRYLGAKSNYISKITKNDSCLFCEQVEEELLAYQYSIGAKANKAAIVDFNGAALTNHFAAKNLVVRAIPVNSGCGSCGSKLYISSPLSKKGVLIREVINDLIRRGKFNTLAPAEYILDPIFYGPLNQIFDVSSFGAGAKYVMYAPVIGSVIHLNFYPGTGSKIYEFYLVKNKKFSLDTMMAVNSIVPDLGQGVIYNGKIIFYGQSGKVQHVMDLITNGVKLSENCLFENLTLCPQGIERDIYIRNTDCRTKYRPVALAEANYRYGQYIDSLWEVFRRDYTSQCINNLKDTLKLGKQSQIYHYTLYYYDLAGNLVKTVPPAGVQTINTITDSVALNANREGRYDSASFIMVQHELPTNYRYNSLNQLVWQKTPDGGESNFWYDLLGRLVSSQNAKQAAIGDVYSYTVYDSLGRITEVGELSGSPLTSTTARNYALYLVWVGAGAKTQITRTYYDEPFSNDINNEFEGGQQNLRNRVASTAYFEFEGDEYTRATHYSYDIHGNVHTLLQEFPELASMGSQFKEVKYDYDLVSGQVNNVAYQQGEADQFYHRYSYDADNRLTMAETSHDHVIWDRDANYKYYKHGPLAKTLLGEHLVQGTDYAYTLHGWLKAVNSNTLQADKDMGKDGNSSSSPVARDAFGFSLGYFNDNSNTVAEDGDYKAISSSTFMATETGSPLGSSTPNLYNGNIKQMVTAVKPFMIGGAAPMATLYSYDQLNRIKQMKTYSSVNFATNTWNSGSASDDFQTDYTYDANGNILTLIRNTDAATNKTMDSLTYHYQSGTNQLTYVDDGIGDGVSDNDIDDQASGNYEYDAIGNLTKDVKEEIASIDWNVYGKIRKINRDDASVKPDLEFQYDASGQRVLKIVKPTVFEGTWKKTYYARDAQGNVMATYGSKNYIEGDSNAFATINNYIYTNHSIATLKTIAQGFSSSSQFAGAYAARLAANTTNYNTLMAGYNVDSLMNWDAATAKIILSNFCDNMTTLEQDNLLNIWVTNRRTAVNLALANSNPTTVFEVLLAVDPTNVILTSLSVNDNPGKITAMYQTAGGPIPSGGTANEITYLRATWTDAQIATQIASLYNSAVLYQVISGLTSAMIKSGLAAGNGIYDCCNLFGTLSTSTADTTVRNVMRDLYGNKTDQKSILVDNANKTYLLGLCASHDWANFVDNSLGLDYQNMALALTDIQYDLSSYLGKVQGALGKASFSSMLSSLDFTITQKWEVNEHFLYGSSRLGVYRSNKVLSSATFEVTDVSTEGVITGKTMIDSFLFVMRTDSFTRVLTEKNYELSNHLGNVLAVVSDRRTPTSSGGINIDYYEADVTSATLYYPFGMELKTYSADSNGYRYGFNGQEKDDEVSGSGNSYTAEFWQYDSRLGRRFNVDPMAYPWQSPYACFDNNPIYFIDANGLYADSSSAASAMNAASSSATVSGNTSLGTGIVGFNIEKNEWGFTFTKEKNGKTFTKMEYKEKTFDASFFANTDNHGGWFTPGPPENYTPINALEQWLMDMDKTVTSNSGARFGFAFIPLKGAGNNNKDATKAKPGADITNFEETEKTNNVDPFGLLLGVPKQGTPKMANEELDKKGQGGNGTYLNVENSDDVKIVPIEKDTWMLYSLPAKYIGNSNPVTGTYVSLSQKDSFRKIHPEPKK